MPITHPGRALAIGLLTLVGDATSARGRPALRPATSSERGALVRELERLVEGLLFMSETDAPLTVITWRRPGGRPTARRVAELVGEPHPELAAEMAVERFFRAATRGWAGQTGPDAASVRRYVTLVRFLQSRLDGARVFRFGKTTIRSYVVGVAPNGDWLGLATEETET